MAVKPVPDGYHTVTPYLVVKDARQVMEFVKAAFDATERICMATPDGKIMHAEVKIGDSIVMLAEAGGAHPPMPGMLHLYVPNVDALYQQAVRAGGKPIREPADQFYGDRSGGVVDASGNQWWISTHKEDVSEEEMARRAAAHK